MNNSFKINHGRVALWIVFLLILGFCIYFFDVKILQCNPSIILSNYSNILLTIWQVQATIASITIASTAFIIGRIDTTYFGISIKNLLYISRFMPRIGLSFWETIVVSIEWLIFTWLALLLDNQATTVYILFVTIVITTFVIRECIKVITKSEIYENFAKKIIQRVKSIVLEDPYHFEYQRNRNNLPSAWQPSERQLTARRQFESIIENLNSEVKLKIKNRSIIRDDPTYKFFLEAMRDFSVKKEYQFNTYMYSIVGQWIRLALDVDSFNIIADFIIASYYASINQSTSNVDIYMRYYYGSNSLSSSSAIVMDELYEEIRTSPLDFTNFTLAIVRNAILQVDGYVFCSSLKAVIFSVKANSAGYVGKIVFITLAYLYYLTFKEELFEIDTSKKDAKIYDLINLTIYEKKINEISKRFTLRDFAIVGNTFFTSLEQIVEFFSVVKNDWEFLPLGRAKWLHLEGDVIEFLAFYSILEFKERHAQAFRNFSLDRITIILKYLNENAELEDNYIPQYLKFYRWITGKENVSEQRISNIALYRTLNQLFKKKLFEEAHLLKSKLTERCQMLKTQKQEIIDTLKKSSFYTPFLTTGVKAYEFKYIDYWHVRDYSLGKIVYGNDEIIKSMIECEIFLKMYPFLDKEQLPEAYSDPDFFIQTFMEILRKYDSLGVVINSSFGYDVISEVEYLTLSPTSAQVIEALKKRLATRSSLPHIDVQTIYIDLKKAHINFSFSDNDIMVTNEELTSEEVYRMMENYQKDDKYFFSTSSNAPVIEFSKDEFEEYLQFSFIKVTFSASYVIPEEKCGFFVNLTQD